MNCNSSAFLCRLRPRCSLYRASVITPQFLPHPLCNSSKARFSTALYLCIKYKLIEYVEDYGSECYHPVYINDHLHDRYRIVHKLGHGSYSTIWLALDQRSSKYVAIKVGTDDADGEELKALKHLNESTQAGVEHSANTDLSCSAATFIPPVIDQFDIQGLEETHPCLVTTPSMGSVQGIKQESHYVAFQANVARSLAAQLALAVSLIHSQGYCHGDLHTGNLLLRMPSSLDNLSIDRLYARKGPPESEYVERADGKPVPPGSGVPLYVVPPVWLGELSQKIKPSEAHPILSDFGVAFRPSDKSRFISQTPLVIRPPEAFFEPTMPLSYGSDIWSLGCTIFELLAHRSLIDGMLPTQDYITAQQVHLQGMMPADWWSRWEERPKWFDQTGKPLSNEGDIWSWDRTFDHSVNWLRDPPVLAKIGDEEKVVFLDMLKRMLTWKPDERPTVDEVLGMPWMRDWALPAYEANRKREGNDLKAV